ncbi:hypothetical protein BN1708_009996 [Verticillium longisporum]|uniref:Uncharacterized protein n=1 Tax=Verticillium longisporum TaxID=100787 RepID=A0A0G4KMT3_VERLO|nr:hypothetical protein BN1708_009996 [Verticillium longisporum]
MTRKVVPRVNVQIRLPAMYMLAPVAGHRFTGREEVYVLDIHRLGAGLASITSDQQLSLFDPARLGAGPITSLPTAHGNIKALRPFDRSASTVCTGGDDGTVALWDLRNPPSSALAARFAAADAPLTALACDAASHTLAVGTEFANHQSSIALWDVRRASPAPRARYAEVHSDDVTELCFHPAEAPGILLSGSTDGVVNVYDTRAADEDDVVVQTLNTGSVHRAAFMSASEVYTLTHDEKLAVFNLDAADDVTELCFHPAEAPGILLSGSTDGVVNVYDTRAADEDDVVVQTLNTGSVHRAAFMSASEVYTLTHDEKLAVFNLDAGYEKGTPVADFGDVRAELACQYVANVTAKVDGSGAIIGVGSQDRQNFQLVHLARGSEKNSWVFDRASSVGLPGGHGEEIVRAFCFYDDEQVVFTAGEDGYIKAWRPN